LCRAIRPLSQFPLDGKRSHGRACYCHPCKRLRGRAQSVSKTYDTAWLRAGLESNTLRERLGAAAESVLSIIQPDKPVTSCLSPDADLEWAGDNTMAWRAAAVRATQTTGQNGSGPSASPGHGSPQAPMQAQHASGGLQQGPGGQRDTHTPEQHPHPTGAANAVPAGAVQGGSTLPGLGTNPPPGPPVNSTRIGMLPMHASTVTSGACAAVAWDGAAVAKGGSGPLQGAPHAQEAGHGEPQGYGEQEGVSVAVGALTRTVLNEVREYTKMCLAVRERMLMPGLTEWQLEIERQTAAELETHLMDLRALVSRAFLGA
jgi:hypothetical protein